MQLPHADPATVKALMARLMRAFEEFATEQVALDPEGLRYIDAVMGCHNFYKSVILDLEHRTGRKEFRRPAVDTLAQALLKEGR